MKRFMLFLAAMLMSCGLAMAQSSTRDVLGTVSNATTGKPIEGARVFVNGTQYGTVTDANGTFKLAKLPTKYKMLTVAFFGMQTENVAVADRMNVTLQDAKQLDEAVVVAYGTAKKSSFTGSASQIKNEKIEAHVTSNVTNALNGQMAGVQSFNSSGAPGEGAAIRIRGIGSQAASNAPLYVIDGVPYDGSTASINMADVESMTVLKDAAANAIYGARGANGVILITTKQGNSKDAKVTVDAKWGSNHRAVPNYKVLGIGNYYETMYRAMYNSQAYHGKSDPEAHAYANKYLLDVANGGLGYQIYTVPAGETLIGTNFKLNPNATLGYSDGDFTYMPDNWYDEFFGKNNLRQEYNVNVSGQTDRMSYYASVGYLNDNGIINNSSFRRYSGRGRVDYQAKKWLKIGTNLDFSETQNHLNGDDGTWNSSANLFNITNLIAPIYPLYVRDASGNIMYETATGTPLYDNGANSTNCKRSFMSMAKPGAIIDNDRHTSLLTTLNGKWYADITPIEGLKLTAMISVMDYNNRSNTLSSLYGSGSTTEGAVSVSHTHHTGVTNQYLATYATTFGELHNVDFLLGYESYKLRMQGLSGSNDHLFDPFIGELGNAHGFSKKKASSSVNNYMTEGFLGRVQYNYHEKYFASASFRRDASSRFHKDDRWGTFGSVGAAWLMTKEDFMKPITWIDVLKVKASFGVQGNDKLLDSGSQIYYGYTDRYSITYSEATGEYSKVLAFKGNKKLTWETSYTWNTGFDFELLKGRLVGSLEYFNRKTTDLLYRKDTPLSSGNPTGFFYTNVGSLRNQGIELDLTGYIFKQKDFDWAVNFNLTHYKNKILSLDPAVAKEGIKSSSQILRVGGSLYEIYMKEFAGVDHNTGEALYWKDITEPVKDAQGNVVTDENGNTVTRVIGRETTTDFNTATQYDLGDALPDVYGGIGTSVHYKGFDLSMQLSYQLGGRAYDGTYQALMHSGESAAAGRNWHKDILNAWSPQNTGSNIPRLDASDNRDQHNSSRFLTSTDYLSLNNITLGYTFKPELVKRFGLGSLRVYVAGENLGVISARKGYDPRMVIGAGSYYSQGSSANYSIMRNITCGLTLNF